MKKWITLINLTLLGILLLGCGSIQYSNDLHTLLEQDREGNKKSVYWDGKEASLIADELDSKFITDGRGWGSYSKVDILNEYEFSYYDNEKPFNIVSDDTTNYILESENQRIIISEIDYNTEKEQLDNNNNFRQTDKLKIREDVVYLFEEYETYSCTVDNYAGYTILIKSKLNNKSYNITCVGIGMLPDIKLQAQEILNSFDVYVE